MKLSERMRDPFGGREHSPLSADERWWFDLILKWADEVAQLEEMKEVAVERMNEAEAEVEMLEKEKQQWWILACKRFAILSEIGEASDKPDDYEWYETGYGHIPVGVDESNSGDWHTHGYEMGVWAMAKKARAALEAGGE